ncbi:MAG TPA: biotin-dependent carboxyltransferase family protein [Xanthobacteraceae bacterium]|nr:biotin-dependent carboxyltransferase family protein [Xanthobacteraceae bacterium]
MSAALRILQPGLLTTVQDLGRVGYQHLGVPTSGALDPVSLRAANILVGNDPTEGALEIAYVGPTFVIEADGVNLACAGAHASIEVLPDETAASGLRYASMQSFRAQRGQVVRVGPTSEASVVYLAVEGGFDIEPVLGSVSTYIRGHIGGWQGRALAAGDALPLRRNIPSERDELRLDGLDLARPSRFRVVLGPQNASFSERSIKAFLDGEYTIGPATDRMAMHLDGPKLEHIAGHDIISDGIALGSIQVPGHGRPIVLMADRQTTGGYPKVATVISADLPALGRSRIGDKISFQETSIEEAQQLRRTLLHQIDVIPNRIVHTHRVPDDLTACLLANNLISGIVNAQLAPFIE